MKVALFEAKTTSKRGKVVTIIPTAGPFTKATKTLGKRIRALTKSYKNYHIKIRKRDPKFYS